MCQTVTVWAQDQRQRTVARSSTKALGWAACPQDSSPPLRYCLLPARRIRAQVRFHPHTSARRASRSSAPARVARKAPRRARATGRPTSRASAGPVARPGLEAPPGRAAPVQKAEPLARAGRQEQVAQQVAAARPGLHRGTIRRAIRKAPRRVPTSIRSAATSEALRLRRRTRAWRAFRIPILAAQPSFAQRVTTRPSACLSRATSSAGAPVMRIARRWIATRTSADPLRCAGRVLTHQCRSERRNGHRRTCRTIARPDRSRATSSHGAANYPPHPIRSR